MCVGSVRDGRRGHGMLRVVVSRWGMVIVCGPTVGADGWGGFCRVTVVDAFVGLVGCLYGVVVMLRLWCECECGV